MFRRVFSEISHRFSSRATTTGGSVVGAVRNAKFTSVAKQQQNRHPLAHKRPTEATPTSNCPPSVAFPTVFSPTASPSTTRTDAAVVNDNHRCGSIVSANANYDHWYMHTYGLSATSHDDYCDTRDLGQLMRLQHADPRLGMLGGGCGSITSPCSSGSSSSSQNANAATTDASSASSSVQNLVLDPKVVSRRQQNAQHAHWFKQQYCLPNWEEVAKECTYNDDITFSMRVQHAEAGPDGSAKRYFNLH